VVRWSDYETRRLCDGVTEDRKNKEAKGRMKDAPKACLRQRMKDAPKACLRQRMKDEVAKSKGHRAREKESREQ